MGRFNVNMKRMPWAVALWLISISVNAGELEDLVEPCIDLNLNHERLACYDEVTRKMNFVAVAGKVSGDLGKWKTRHWTSPLDDSTNYIATLEADGGIPGQLNIRTVTPELSIRCKEGELDAFISWKRFISIKSVTQTMRFDRNTAYDQAWTISTNYESLFAPASAVTGFTTRVMVGSYMYAQVTPHGESPVGVHFNLNGGKVAVLRAFQACGML